MAVDKDSILIARIDQRTQNTDKNFEEHTRHDDERFDRMFKYLDKRFDEVNNNLTKQTSDLGKKIADMGVTVSSLWDEKKERDGADKTKTAWKAAGGYSFNALIAAFTAWATFKLIGR